MCGTYSITCPGVWLCTNGYLETTIKTLGYFFKTGAMEPKFPALCHDQFLMEGYFKSIRCISELEQVLAAESIEITLWQNGRRLAYFVGQLADVMRPPMPKLSCFHNVNVQILMNPTQAFPGIIAPKLEISARAVIQDRKCCSKDTCSLTGSSNHSLLISNLQKPTPTKSQHCHDDNTKDTDLRRQQPVCHTKIYGSKTGKPASSISQINERGMSSKDSIFSRNESVLESRRISSCSSSNTCSSFGTTSDSSLSKCSHSSSNPLATEQHQKNCNICLSYKKAFDPLTGF